MNFRITIICDNSVGPISGTLGEHGLAVLVEPSGGEPLLFDTGQGATLLHNLHRMNRDPAAIGKVIISHGHFDHAGGLQPLLQTGRPRRVFGHPGIFAGRYRLKDSGERVETGIPHSRETLEEAGAVFDLSPAFREIETGMFLSGEVPRRTSFEQGDRGLFRDGREGEPDDTPDDQSLLLETEKGLVIILGCCHSGLINTLEHTAETMGRRDVYAVLGGTHLGFCGREQLDQTILALKGWGISRLAASHCTGFAASARLWREMPAAFQPAQVGYTLEV